MGLDFDSLFIRLMSKLGNHVVHLSAHIEVHAHANSCMLSFDLK